MCAVCAMLSEGQELALLCLAVRPLILLSAQDSAQGNLWGAQVCSAAPARVSMAVRRDLPAEL